MKKIFLYSTIALSLISCKLDDNIDPNLPMSETLSARNTLAAAQTSSYDAHASAMNELGNVFSNIWAGNVYYFANPYGREFNLAIDNNFYGGIWNNLYLSTNRLQNIINGPNNTTLPYHVAIAKILKANNMQYIVDLYGDAPYSEAFHGQEIMSPKYDKGEDIYKNLVLEINEALVTLAIPSNVNNEVKGAEDPIMGGDLDNWVKFANTVKLRILLRQSKVQDATIQAFVNQQLATLTGADFVDFDVTINPGYSNSTTENFNPIYREFGRVMVDGSTNTQGWRAIKASDYYANKVEGTSPETTGVVDGRGIKQFLAVGGKVSGIIQGDVKQPGKAESNFSFLGWKFGVSNAGGGLANAGMDGYLMLKAESLLLQSEAAVLYPALFSNAETKYNEAVQDSFTFYSAGDANAYLAALSTKPYGWAGSGANKMQAIQYQRMVCLANLRSIETFINYSKTGYPSIPLALTAQKPRKPYRLIYPVSEYTGNTANVPQMQNDDAFVKNQYTPFWNRN